MDDLDIVTHISVEKAQADGFKYLHESSIAWHNGRLYAVWANHRDREVNISDELIRGKTSDDGGFTWSDAFTIAAPPMEGSASYNHPVIASVDGTLWGFFTRWDHEKPSTEIFTMDNATGAWTTTGTIIPTLVPFSSPMKMANGNWIVSGESFWYEPAVAISKGDDFSQWDLVVIPRPNDVEILFAETTLLQRGTQLVAICRPKNDPAAPVAVSDDFGRTWSPLEPSNFPIDTAQPFCHKLSNGQQVLVTNSLEERRHLISIAVTRPNGGKFERIWKLRHQQFPRVRYFGGWGEGSRAGCTTEWSYPSMIEHDDKLYVVYTQGKEDCCVSIIPMRVLEVNA